MSIQFWKCNCPEYNNHSSGILRCERCKTDSPFFGTSHVVTEYRFVIPGDPMTKKNHRPIFRAGNRPFIGKSQSLRDAEEFIYWRMVDAKSRQNIAMPIAYPVHIKFLFYRKTKRKIDLSNLYELPQDCLVKAGVLADDTLIESHDGSRKLYDRENPRTEIIIVPFAEDVVKKH